MSKNGRIFASSVAVTVVAGTAMAGLLVAPAQAAEAAASSPVVLSSSDDGACSEKKTVGNARHKGDIFHSYVKTAVYNHNHVGIYYTTKTIVEAPGKGTKSKSVTASTLKKCGPIYKMYVKAKQSSRDKAANYAYKHYRGKAYDTNFAANKSSNSTKLNCSELVWKAYNIKDDGSTVRYATIK